MSPRPIDSPKGNIGTRIKIGRDRKESSSQLPSALSSSSNSLDSASHGSGIALSGVGLALSLGGATLLFNGEGKDFGNLAESILQGANLIGGPEIEQLVRKNHRFVGGAISIPGTVSFYSGRKMMGEDKKDNEELTSPS